MIKSIIALVFVLLFSALALAQSPAPQMPTFTQSKVEQMLASIDKGYNFTLLRVGYFGGHIKSPFPATKGFEILKSILKEQQKGSAKWFLLESLRGFAGFHSPDISMDEGFDAYELIFDSAKLATTSRSQATVRRFVSTIPSITDRKGWDARFAGLLLKAWQTWHAIPLSDFDKDRPLDWGQAIKEAGAQSQFVPIVNKLLEDVTVTPDFQTLKMAVIVFENRDQARVIQLLKTAQRKLQPDDHYNQKWLYETWAQLITGNSPQEEQGTKITDKTQLAQLVEMRKDQISYTGTGYADLLKLYWQLGQNDKANDLLTAVKASGIRASEKIDVAKVLLRPPTDLEFSEETTAQLQQQQGVSLLQAYLTMLQENPSESPVEKRELLEEIRARYELGRYFIKQDQITEALRALNVDALKPPARNTWAAMYYAQIQKMKAELAEKLKGVDGVR